MRLSILLFALLPLACDVNLNNHRTVNAQGFKTIRHLSIGKKKAELFSFPMANGNTLFEIRGSISLNEEKERYSCYFNKNPITSGESPFLIHVPDDLSTITLSPEMLSFKLKRNNYIELELKTGPQRLFIRDRISEVH